MSRETYQDNQEPEVDLKPMSKREKAKETLLSYCEKTGNSLVFIDPGKENKNPPKEINFDTEVEMIKGTISMLEVYLNAPMFTDSFHVDRDSRDEWEKNLENQVEENIVDENVKDFYESNRLKKNTADQVSRLLMVVPPFLADSKMAEKFEAMEKEIPREFFYQNGESPKYDLMSDQEKIAVMNRFAEVVKKIIQILKENNFSESEKN